MKWILPISLIILLSFVSTYDNKAISEKSLQRMVEHLTKLRNLFRNLEEEDTSDSEPSESSDESSSEETSTTPNSTETSTIPGTLPAPDVSTNNKDAGIQLLNFNSFANRGNQVTFETIFLFIDRIPPPKIFFILSFVFNGGIRNLEEVKNETATCITTTTQKTDENVIYTCEAPNNVGNFKQILVNPDFTYVDENGKNQIVKGEEINFSQDAALALQNLQNKNKKINKVYILQNGVLQQNPKWDYFIISGDIKGYNGDDEDSLTLEFYDSNKELQTASCKIKDKNSPNYTFKCTSGKAINGNLDLSSMFNYNDKEQITLYMTSNDPLNYNPTGGSNTRNNPTYKKSSSGLSGGAIAGIVIACAVVLIIASVIAMMMRKPAVPVNNNTSVVGLRTTDNYIE